MPKGAHAKKKDERQKLVSILGGKEPTGVGELLSGRISRAPRTPKRRKTELPAQQLPREIAKIANLFAAARSIKKEIESKEQYARTRIDEFCFRDFAHRAARSDRRPGSVDYATEYARFKFVVTARTTLTPEKEEALRDLGLPLNEHTRLAGIEINYEAIRSHGLEDRLREALESMDIDRGILEECFRPKVELKDTFYDRLPELVRSSLPEGEELEERLEEVFRILQPTAQLRNVDVIGLNAQECFDLVNRTQIEAEEEIA